jgi:hypothetical protein
MMKCIERKAYGQAFGANTQARLVTMLEKDIAACSASNGGSNKKLFGMF